MEDKVRESVLAKEAVGELRMVRLDIVGSMDS
jgi:hypothetical protein